MTSRIVSKGLVGPGQYRNAVASGLPLHYMDKVHPTLPRYGTDPVQVSSPNFEAKAQ